MRRVALVFALIALASTLLRTGRDSLSEIVGADAATITAEDWPTDGVMNLG